MAAVARRLGVAPATLRTWDRRYGLGPTLHPAGSHRRYSRTDIARLEAMRRLVLDGVPPADAARLAVDQVPPAAGPGTPDGTRPSGADPADPDRALVPAVPDDALDPPDPAGALLLVDPGDLLDPVDRSDAVDRAGRAKAAPPTGRADAAAADADAAERASPADRARRTSAVDRAGRADAVDPARRAAVAYPHPAGGPDRSHPAGGPDRSHPAGAPDRSHPAGGPDSAGELRGPGPVGPAAGVDTAGPARSVDGARPGGPGGRVLALPGGTAEARGLARAAMALDSASIRAAVDRTLRSQGVVPTWTDLLCPVLVAVGERWATTGEGVEVEHLLAETADSALRAVSSAPEPGNGRPVLLACAPEEQHSLPLTALAAALAEQGIGTRLLGSGLPAAALSAAVRRTGPAAVMVWSHWPGSADPGVLDGLPVLRPPVAVLAGGTGWLGRRLPPRVSYVPDLSSAVGLIARTVGT